ncbi:MAG: LacI family DNA-binding transcriptional regulator [Pseudomonadota bacterium]
MSMRKIRNMEEFASVIGISRPTVSKYFNDPESVRATTKRKIEDALERYDYSPNVYALNQNRRKTRNIGIVVPYLADPFFAEIGRAVELACIAAGYTPVLLSSHGSPAQEIEDLTFLKSLKPAGVLLAPFGRLSDRSAIERLEKSFPLVQFDAKIDGVGRSFIGSDNAQSVDLMVEYLCRTGEPPCFFEMRTPSNPNANKRRVAYEESMARHGHEPRIFQAVGEGWTFEEIGREQGGAMLSKGVFPTNTLLCSNDRLAIGVLSAAYSMRKRVGHAKGCDLRIAGHDDHPFSQFTCPSLTTIAQDYVRIADRAVADLLRIMDGDSGDGEWRETLFEGRLVMRDSA